MRTRLILLVVLLVAGLGGSLFAFRERLRHAEAEAALANITLARQRLEAEAAGARARLAKAAAADRPIRQQLAAIRAKGAKAATTKKAVPAPLTALRQALLNDPQLQSLQIAAVRPKFESTYRPFLQQLKLSPEQERDFLAIIFKRYEQDMDLGAIREVQASAPNDPVFAKMKQQFATENSAAFTALLGPEGYRRFSDYERAVPAREFLDQTAGASAVSGAPLTGLQADALTQIISDASAAYQRGGTIELRTVDWNRVVANANSVLTDSQLAVFRLGVIQLHNMEKIRVLAATR